MTTPTYGRAFRDFVRWCRSRRLSPMPAHPWTVAAYLIWCEHRHPHAAIVKRLKAISRAHIRHCRRVPDRHPTVVRTLREIERRCRTLGDRAALFDAADFLEEASLDEASGGQVPEGPEDAPARRRQTLRSKPRLVERRPRKKRRKKAARRKKV